VKVFILAGEASGDKLGGALMAGLQSLSTVEFGGVGGPMMVTQGLRSLFEMNDLAVMGLLEVVPRLPKLLRRIKETVAAAARFGPDVLITIDSPDFCLRVAAQLKVLRPQLRVVHYVAPSVWAWRPERAQKMARYVDHVLALLPFEPPYMTAAGMSCDFVGHPLVAEPVPTCAEVQALAQDLGVDPQRDRLVCLLPGSRKGEIDKMAPIHAAVAEQVLRDVPNVKFVLPVSAGIADKMFEKVQYWPVKPIMLDPRGLGAEKSEHRKRTAFHLCAAALATSGTVALELAAADCPMVVAYRANYFTTRMVKKLARIDTANLINIVTDTRVIPEFLFEACRPALIAPALSALLSDPQSQQVQRAACTQTLVALGRGGEDPGLRAARSVLHFIG
jgi:lipid-A-disaccharide synthase